jgi:hypothetical protein
MLDAEQLFAQGVWQRFAQEQAEMRIQLIDIPHGVNPQRVLVDARPVSKTGGAAVAGAGCNAGKAMPHVVSATQLR